MPFQSDKQRRYMPANLPDIANRWEAKYGLGGVAELNSQLNQLPEYYLPKNQGGLIPSHEAGIYGLAEGGRTGFFKGAQADTASGKSMSPGTSASGGSRHEGGGGWSPGVGGTQHIPTPKPDPEPTDDKITIDELYESNKPKNTRAQLILGKLQAKYPHFFQLDSAKKINQMKNMSWKEALNLEKQMSKSLFGKGFTGPDKVGSGKYITEGIKSLFMNPSKWSSQIGGATPLVKKLATLAGEKVLPTVMGGANVLSAPLAYVQGASVLQNFLESQGMPKGAMGDDILARGVEAAGTDVLSVPTDIYESSQDVPPEYSGTWEGQDGGIAGLKQGGRIGFFTGMREAEQEAQSTDGGYQNVHQTGAVTQTPGRTTTPREVPPGEKGGPGYVSPEDLKKLEFKELIDKQQLEKGPIEYYGLKDLQLKQKDKKQMIKEKIEGEWQRYMDPSTWQKVQNLYAMTNLKGIVQEIFKGIKRTSDMNAFMQDLKDLGLAGGAPGTNDPLYDQLWLHLEKGKGKYRYDDEGGPEGPQETGIKYENIEEFNEDKMAQASTEANTILEDVRNAKRDAYLAAFRQKYLMGDTEKAAHGGRIPGYNTGGLSNLFRLKNV